MLNLDKFFFLKKKIKFLKFGFKKKIGRNFLGRITVYSKGYRKKIRFNLINFFYTISYSGVILNIYKDYYRNAKLALILYKNGFFSFNLMAENLYKGYILNGLNYEINKFENILEKGVFKRQNVLVNVLNDGNSFNIYKIPLLKKIFNLEIFPKSGAKYSRSAGCFSLILSKKYDKILIKLSSGKKVILNENCIATLGQVSNLDYKFIKKKKASNNVIYGRKSSVRGVAMNPCDHPHGGGNGKKSKKRIPRTPWGKFTNTFPIKNKRLKKKDISYFYKL